MLKSKNKVCVECGRDDKPWFSKKRCKSCSQKSYGKPKVKSKPTGELALFLELWRRRPHKSFVSGEPLPFFKVSQMAHVLPKSIYDSLRLEPDNIVFLTEEEHHLYDHGTTQQREKYALDTGANWQPLYDIRDELKERLLP